jgi:hypothetical protein
MRLSSVSSEASLERSPEVDVRFSAGARGQRLICSVLSIFECGCDKSGTISVLCSVRRSSKRGVRPRSRGFVFFRPVPRKLPSSPPRKSLHNIKQGTPSSPSERYIREPCPTCITVGQEMFLRIAGPLASLLFFSALAVAQINWPNCTSTSWQWVSMLSTFFI